MPLWESSITYLTLESFEWFMNINEVAFKAIKRWKTTITVTMTTKNILAFCILTLKHVLKLFLNLLFFEVAHFQALDILFIVFSFCNLFDLIHLFYIWFFQIWFQLSIFNFQIFYLMNLLYKKLNSRGIWRRSILGPIFCMDAYICM